jgi:hypothetical protein
MNGDSHIQNTKKVAKVLMSKAMKYGFELNDAKVAKFSVGRSFPAGSLFFSGTGFLCLRFFP